MSRLNFWFTCPKCGKDNSCEDGGYCGKCEQQYRTEQENGRLADLAEAEKDMTDLEAKHGPCDCTLCMKACIRILRLKGQNQEANQLLNA